MPTFEKEQDPVAAYKRCIKAAQFRVRWKDVFNAKDMYRTMHEWAAEYGWTDMEDGQDHYEAVYSEKIGMYGDKELWIRWRWQKMPADNSYYKYHMDVDMHFLYLLPTEVVHEGKKLKKDMYKGEVEFMVTALIEPDHMGQWSKHPVLKNFNKIFPERIFRKDLYEEHKRELYREAYIFQNFLKQWFKLKRFLPYEEGEQFHPTHAYPSYMSKK